MRQMQLGIRLVSALALLLVLFGGLSQPQLVSAQGAARIRIVNASPDATALNVYLNNAPAVRQFGTGDIYGYFQVSPGRHMIGFRVGSQNVDKTTVQLNLAANDYVTVVAFNKVNSLQALVLRDDISPVVRGQARVRIVNTIVGGVPVDLLNRQTNLPLLENVAFATASPYTMINAATYNFAIAPSQQRSTILARADNTNLLREKRYDLFVIGQQGGRIRVITAQTDTQRASGTNQIRFGNFVTGTTQLDVYINNVIAFERVAPGTLTSFALIVAPGQYVVDVKESRQTDILATLAITVNKDESVLVVASSQAERPFLRVFTEDFSKVRLGTSRLTVINLTNETSPATIQLADQTVLIVGIPHGQAQSVVLGSGPYSLSIQRGAVADATNLTLRLEPINGHTLILYDGEADSETRTFEYSYVLTPITAVRFVHASAALGAVDVYLDGDKIADNWQYKSATNYVDLSLGQHTIKLYRAGAATHQTPLLEREIDASGFPVTMVALDGSRGIVLTPFPDNLQALTADKKARVRAINAAPNLGAVIWTNMTNRTRLYESAFGVGDGTPAIDMVAGTYNFRFATITASQAIELKNIPAAPGVFTTFILLGKTSQDVLLLTYPLLPTAPEPTEK